MSAFQENLHLKPALLAKQTFDLCMAIDLTAFNCELLDEISAV